MRNAAFCLLTEPEKSSKFRAILNEKTERTLTGEEMRSILLCVSPHRQYSIKVHSDADRFREVLQLSNGFRGKTVLGQVLVSHDIKERPEFIFWHPPYWDMCALFLYNRLGNEE